jgi:hypothetical protein
LHAVIRLDAATVLLQWAAGGLLFCWLTVRNSEIGRGYTWLLHGIYAVMAAGSFAAGIALGAVPIREVASAIVFALALLTVRRTPPHRLLLAPLIGGIGVVAGAFDASSGGWDSFVASYRVVIGAMFLGAITDAMLLGHWYLVQPGMQRKLLKDLVDVMYWALPLEVIALLLPTGMVSVINGSIDDGWNGMLGWFWIACVVMTAVLVVVTKAALKERSYSAVMAATGLLYLAILTAFGTDLVARATLAQG